MQHKFAPECVDRTLQDICNSEKPFGGITVVFGGDFQQILPVVIKGSQEQIISACLQCSKLWKTMSLLYLKQNMHLSQSDKDRAYAKWLQDIGKGDPLLTAENGSISVPEFMRCGNSVESLINCIYPSLCTIQEPRDKYLLERTILYARNDDIDEINAKMLQMFPGEVKTFFSADKVILEEGADVNTSANAYPVEYLNSITYSGLPLSKLQLKIGCPLMILQNIDPSKGLCNGTHCVLV